MQWRSQVWRGIAAAVAVAAAGWLLLLASAGDRQVALLIFLPGIFVVDWFFGLSSGLVAVGLSVAASATYRLAILPGISVPLAARFAWENETVILLAGLLLVWVFELRRASQAREVGGREHLRQLLAAMAEAAFVFDHDLRLVDANAAAFRLLARRPDELIGRSAATLSRAINPYAKEARDRRMLQRALEGQGSGGVRGGFDDSAHGRRLEVLASATPLRNAARDVTGVLLLLSDITEVAGMERRMTELEKHEAMGRMAAGITHDFNNILAVVQKADAVLGLMEGRPESERRRYRDMLHTAVRRGRETVARLREYLAGGEGEMALLDLNEIARQAVELTAPLWRQRSKVRLQTNFGQPPPVRGSAVDLRRALTNLLLNAFEAIGDQPGRVTLQTERDGDRALCWIEDTGPGIPREEQSKIFLPYHTTKPRGTGLGLSGAQRIALTYGGNLTLRSEPGHGARFQLELPAVPADQAAHQAEVPPPSPPPATAAPAFRTHAQKPRAG
ncbi:MAG: two-component system sensor histidine kinase NtrB [Terriglobales bacterium]